jgi:transposase, IS5 family
MLISSRRQGMAPQVKKDLRRCSAVEPAIGRNYLLGALGDKINALLCGAGHLSA